ncbi:hypothetical protein [Leptospira adleri]|nr:hypothetical protein [Leptospira adleri]
MITNTENVLLSALREGLQSIPSRMERITTMRAGQFTFWGAQISHLIHFSNLIKFLILFILFFACSWIIAKEVKGKKSNEPIVDFESIEKSKVCNNKLDQCLSDCLRKYPHWRDFRQSRCRDYCMLDYKNKCDAPVYIKSNRI